MTLQEALAEIKASLRAIECEVCKVPMGYVEGEAPAAFCSDRCVKVQARRSVT